MSQPADRTFTEAAIFVSVSEWVLYVSGRIIEVPERCVFQDGSLRSLSAVYFRTDH
jgi:hypothetical protein